MTQTATPGAAFGRYEWVFIALGALAAFWLHWHFRMSGFGEQDAGRLATDAINWHFEGSIDMTKVDYRLHTSPLYIHSMKLALDHGMSVRSIPVFMNGLSVLASSACMVGLYLLFRQLSTPAIATAAPPFARLCRLPRSVRAADRARFLDQGRHGVVQRGIAVGARCARAPAARAARMYRADRRFGHAIYHGLCAPRGLAGRRSSAQGHPRGGRFLGELERTLSVQVVTLDRSQEQCADHSRGGQLAVRAVRPGLVPRRARQQAPALANLRRGCLGASTAAVLGIEARELRASQPACLRAAGVFGGVDAVPAGRLPRSARLAPDRDAASGRANGPDGQQQRDPARGRAFDHGTGAERIQLPAHA